ncbi:MAG TPA: hypothetical protein VF680_17495 [Allosphingosinicella sp.]|jgi:hypothetical protein
MTANWITLGVSVVALAFISLTMLLRGNDFRRRSLKDGRLATLRLLGFVLAGFSPWGIVGWWFFLGLFPSPFMAAFLTGVAFVFFTSPNLPPWHKFLTEGSDA